MALHEANGAWPAGLSSDTPEFPELPHDASWPEAARHYGTVTTHLASTLPKVVQALEFLRDAGHQMAFDIASLRASQSASLPPMRPESPSTVSIAQDAVRTASGEFAQVARLSAGPEDLVQAPTAKLTEIAQRAVDRALAQKEVETKAKLDAAELAGRRAADARAAEKLSEAAVQRAKDRRRLGMALALMLISAAGAYLKAKAEVPTPAAPAVHASP